MNKTILSVLVAGAMLLPLAGALSVASPETPTERYIVAFVEDPGLRAGDTYQGERVVDYVPDLEFVVVETSSVTLFETRVNTDDRVRYVERDNPTYAILSLVPNDALYNDPGHYGTKITKAETAWDSTTGSTSIKVGMLDTGINRNHEDFTGGRVLQGYDFYNNDNDPADEGGLCSYHGSHTSGTVGATINNAKGIAGLAQVQLLPVKAFGGFLCGGSTTALVNGLKYIADQGSHVSSNSWGSSEASAAMNDAITYAHNKGTIHVAAAGNDGACTDCVGYPWKQTGDKVIIVSASDNKDAFASFSSQGPEVDVIAPGVGILSVNGGGGYQTMDGTSMAAPHVSGVAALVKTQNPGWSFSQVESQIKSTADNIGLTTDRQGSGRLDAAEAVGSGSGGGGTATAPGAPQSLTAAHAGAPKSGKINLNWQAPASDGGAAITSYKIYRGTSSGGETYLTTVGNVLSWQDSGLTKGTTYYYQVTAVNSVGEGARSNEASAVG